MEQNVMTCGLVSMDLVTYSMKRSTTLNKPEAIVHLWIQHLFLFFTHQNKTSLQNTLKVNIHYYITKANAIMYDLIFNIFISPVVWTQIILFLVCRDTTPSKGHRWLYRTNWTYLVLGMVIREKKEHTENLECHLATCC